MLSLSWHVSRLCSWTHFLMQFVADIESHFYADNQIYSSCLSSDAVQLVFRIVELPFEYHITDGEQSKLNETRVPVLTTPRGKHLISRAPFVLTNAVIVPMTVLVPFWMRNFPIAAPSETWLRLAATNCIGSKPFIAKFRRLLQFKRRAFILSRIDYYEI